MASYAAASILTLCRLNPGKARQMERSTFKLKARVLPIRRQSNYEATSLCQGLRKLRKRLPKFFFNIWGPTRFHTKMVHFLPLWGTGTFDTTSKRAIHVVPLYQKPLWPSYPSLFFFFFPLCNSNRESTGAELKCPQPGFDFFASRGER